MLNLFMNILAQATVAAEPGTEAAAPAATAAPETTTAATTSGAAGLTSEEVGRFFADAGKNPFGEINRLLDGHWDFLTDPKALWGVLSQIHIVWAGIFMLVGGICVMNGYRWHRVVILMLAGMLGVYAGTVMGGRIGGTNVVAACAAVLFAVIAWPMMRYSVSLFGGLAGAFAGANVWTALGFPQANHQYGAIIGLLVVGMLAFTAFRVVVIVLTTVGGASMLIMGAMAAMMHVDSWRGGIESAMTSNRLIVPIVVASSAIVGAIFQFGGGVNGLNAMAAKADPARGQAKKAA